MWFNFCLVAIIENKPKVMHTYVPGVDIEKHDFISKGTRLGSLTQGNQARVSHTHDTSTIKLDFLTQTIKHDGNYYICLTLLSSNIFKVLCRGPTTLGRYINAQFLLYFIVCIEN